MAKKTVGELIREARTNAGLTQEQLAKKIDGVSAADISKAERGEKELTQAALKAIAKATGVTQKSLLEAAAAGKKTASSKKTTTTTKKAPASTKAAASEKKTAPTTKKTASTSKKTTTTQKKTTTKKKTAEPALTAAEKRVLELYRAANAETRKAAEALLKGEKVDTSVVGTMLGGAMDILKNIAK